MYIIIISYNLLHKYCIPHIVIAMSNSSTQETVVAIGLYSICTDYFWQQQYNLYNYNNYIIILHGYSYNPHCRVAIYIYMSTILNNIVGTTLTMLYII